MPVLRVIQEQPGRADVGAAMIALGAEHPGRSLKMRIAIAMTVASGAFAQTRMVYGAGMISCGEWQQYRSSGDKPNSYQAHPNVQNETIAIFWRRNLDTVLIREHYNRALPEGDSLCVR
jgi:hypothetical protein